jgi:hypothetical protein
MLPERFKARKLESVDRDSGMDLNRLQERSSDDSEFANGIREAADIVSKLLSAKDRCFRNLHFVAGRLAIRPGP